MKRFALYLQRSGGDPFAGRPEISSIIEEIFSARINASDSPNELRELLYKVCRRHAALTTETQFYDTAGAVGVVVDFNNDDRVGFSHNVLREFLVSEVIIGYIESDGRSLAFGDIAISSGIIDFIAEATKQEAFVSKFRDRYQSESNPAVSEKLFKIAYFVSQKTNQNLPHYLGQRATVTAIDISDMKFSNSDLRDMTFLHCISENTDFTNCDLRGACFKGSIIDFARLDGATVDGADFSEADIVSIYASDEYQKQNSAILKGKAARQWLFSRKANVSDEYELNKFLGQTWYHASREVAHTIVQKFPRTFSETSLWSGTKLQHREFAKDFTEFLAGQGFILQVTKSKRDDCYVFKANKEHISDIKKFDADGTISEKMMPFFKSRI